MTTNEDTLSLTIELPESVMTLLTHIARQTHHSPAELAAQSITGNLPPTIDNAPPEIQADLSALQNLTIAELKIVAKSEVPLPQQQRHLALLENQDTLSEADRQELQQLRLHADQLMLKKAYAWRLLRWRGQPIPPLQALPLP